MPSGPYTGFLKGGLLGCYMIKLHPLFLTTPTLIDRHLALVYTVAIKTTSIGYVFTGSVMNIINFKGGLPITPQNPGLAMRLHELGLWIMG